MHAFQRTGDIQIQPRIFSPKFQDQKKQKGTDTLPPSRKAVVHGIKQFLMSAQVRDQQRLKSFVDFLLFCEQNIFQHGWLLSGSLHMCFLNS